MRYQAFSGIESLYGKGALEKLENAHIAIIGLGGVGSWTAEALARSGIGEITLIDMDEVCVSNINRQLHALGDTIGKSKIDVLKSRLLQINSDLVVHLIQDFYTPSSAEDILSVPYSLVVDAIDGVVPKMHLIDQCQKRNIPLICVGGAGGKRAAHLVQVGDLALSFNDRLLKEVRKKLRQDYGFSRKNNHPFGIPCVFSPEKVRYPGLDGSVCEKPQSTGVGRIDCQSGLGTASFVTGTFGFMAANLAIHMVLDETLY